MDDPQKLIDAINQLNERLKVVEAAKGSPEASSPEGMRDRQEREREVRKTQNEAERYLKKTGNGATPVIPRRYEEIKHRYSEMKTPAQAVQKVHPKNEELSGLTIYCWKDGKAGTIRLAVKTGFAEIQV